MEVPTARKYLSTITARKIYCLVTEDLESLEISLSEYEGFHVFRFHLCQTGSPGELFYDVLGKLFYDPMYNLINPPIALNGYEVGVQRKIEINFTYTDQIRVLM